jgi:hypothetical protein
MSHSVRLDQGLFGFDDCRHDEPIVLRKAQGEAEERFRLAQGSGGVLEPCAAVCEEARGRRQQAQLPERQDVDDFKEYPVRMEREKVQASLEATHVAFEAVESSRDLLPCRCLERVERRLYSQTGVQEWPQEQ